MSLNPKIIRTKFNAILEALSIKFGKYRDFQVVLSDGRRVYGRAEFDEKTVDIAIDDELIHEPKVKMDGRWASLSEEALTFYKKEVDIACFV